MANTWREDAIVEAIEIIADKKIAQAGYDKTIKGVINQVLDETTGKYEIKYQDSLFEAYATSSKLSYQKDQLVSVLIPGNDWDRVKIILGGVENNVITYNSIPVASNQYNAIGMSGTELTLEIGLSSYIDESHLFINGQGGFSINEDSYKYIKKGDSLALKMNVRTSFASSQVGGNYGVIFRLVFKDNVTGELRVRSFSVDKKDVIGQPYNLKAVTPVEVLFTDVDTLNFIRIDSILAFCEGFPLDDSNGDIKDIFISGIYINGADALTEEALSGYYLHIYDSNGNEINSSKNIILLVAQLKLSGRIVTENVQYFWGIEDATVFKGATGKYSGYLGDGWKCLNYYENNLRAFIPFTDSKFYFTSQSDKVSQNTALLTSRLNKIKCVVVLSGNTFEGLIQVINTLLGKVLIISSDKELENKNQTVYYLDNGKPDLTCKLYNASGQLITNNLTYQWSIFPSVGKGRLVETINTGTDDYVTWTNTWNDVKNELDRVADNQKDIYKSTTKYTSAEENIKKVLSKPYIYKNKYYNFPVNSISGSTKICCAVYQGNTYKGTGSITLENRITLEGMYSLNIENGSQVFQYDTKGNSPASKQLDKPLLILPLNFTLVDNLGTIITHDQIRLNGWIKWIIPSTQTLLLSVNNGTGETGANDITVLRSNLPLAASQWQVYKNKDFFNFSIADRYDSKNNINYIWLNIKYKDLYLDAYTDFSFPKDGDPGTNGTDVVAKITTTPVTDWIYISNKAPLIMFVDDGSTIDNLKFLLYNNSKRISLTANYWICPPATTTASTADSRKDKKTYLGHKINQNWNYTILASTAISKNALNIKSDKPINIVRGQYGGSGSSAGDIGNLKYFAETPICTEYVSNANYRIKIKPKTGFKYVVYSEDGTRPDYDNTSPFEIIVLTVNTINGKSIYIADTSSRTYIWSLIGNLEFDSNLNTINNLSATGKKRYIKPKDKFTGLDLSSAIVVLVSGIGFIHIPIYMILNRYGHTALNGWDGNSIELNANGDTILAPQIGAGKKLSDNTFTGILMGDVKTSSSTDTGIMGYHKGQRSIFLDSKTGNATFGKQGAAQIKITADSGEGTIQSGDYNYKTTDHTGTGLKIKFSSTGTGTEKGPYIRYGSNKFSVNSEGNIHASGGGDIAGWNITDSTLYKSNVGLNSNINNSSYNPNTAPNDTSLSTNNGNMAFWAGSGTGNLAKNFYVTHNGYLYSKSGKIAKWNINNSNLTDGNVGMGLMTSNNYITANTFNNQSSQITNGRIWANNNFVVDNNGKLWSKSGQIGPWALNNTSFTNGNTGLGSNTISTTDMNNAFGIGTASNAVQARIWASTAGTNASVNFVVSNDGKLYSKAGKLGGWNIEKDKLWAVDRLSGKTGIRLNADGSMNGGAGYSRDLETLAITGGSWAIYKDGNSTFNGITVNNLDATTVDATDIVTHNITANDGGTIASWNINEDYLLGSGITISSKGSISAGDNWSITGSGDGYFKNLFGTIKSGQTLSNGGSGNGAVSFTGGGGGSWGGPTGTMVAKKIKVFQTLTLKRVSAGATPSGVFYCFGRNKALSECIDIKQSGTTSISGTISGTVDGHSISGTCTVDVPKYVIDIKNDYRLVLDVSQIGANIVTGWQKVDTVLPSFLCSEDPSQNADSD